MKDLEMLTLDVFAVNVNKIYIEIIAKSDADGKRNDLDPE